MTEEMYTDLFLGSEPTKVPWFIVMVKEKRSEDHFFMCQYIVNVMRIIADELQGSVRFAYINAPQQEKLKETFDIKTLPTSLFIKDGQVYEHNMMQVLYNNIVQFIEGGYDHGP